MLTCHASTMGVRKLCLQAKTNAPQLSLQAYHCQLLNLWILIDTNAQSSKSICQDLFGSAGVKNPEIHTKAKSSLQQCYTVAMHVNADTSYRLKTSIGKIKSEGNTKVDFSKAFPHFTCGAFHKHGFFLVYSGQMLVSVSNNSTLHKDNEIRGRTVRFFFASMLC